MLETKNKQVQSFTELHDWATGYALTNLIERGGPGLKSAIHLIMTTTISWNREVDAEEKERIASERKIKKQQSRKKK